MLSHFYDSPTFLGQKDKYFFGLTLVEVMMLLGVGFLTFILSLAFPVGFMTRMLLVIPITGAMAVLMFARLSGLSIPAFIFLAVLGMFRRPSFEVTKEFVLSGDPAWVEERNQRSERRMGLLFQQRRSAKAPEGGEVGLVDELGFEARKVEIQAEVDKQVTVGVVAAEQWVREGVRTLFKGS